MDGLGGNANSKELSIYPSLKIQSWDSSWPKGLLPKIISYKITPQLQTSTFESINGLSLKHSGGRYQ